MTPLQEIRSMLWTFARISETLERAEGDRVALARVRAYWRGEIAKVQSQIARLERWAALQHEAAPVTQYEPPKGRGAYHVPSHRRPGSRDPRMRVDGCARGGAIGAVGGASTNRWEIEEAPPEHHGPDFGPDIRPPIMA